MMTLTQSIEELAVAKAKCEASLLNFTRYFFYHRFGRKFVIGEHHIEICNALDKVIKGECKKLIINIAPRYGKAIATSTPMFTKRGWIYAGDVVPGDYLIGKDGCWTSVLGVYPQGIKKANEVTFNDGSKILCCDEHLWEVQSRRHKKNFIKTTNELKGSLIGGDGHFNWRIPVVSPLQLEEKELPINPYLFGCWLGDGSTYKAEICTMDEEIIECFESYGVTIRKHQNAGRATEYGIRGGFITKLKSLNVIGNKHIPEIYFNSSYKDRLSLLQGLCDTDGTCNKKNKQISIAITNKLLELHVKRLICSLGGVYRNYYRKNNGSCNISFRIPNEQPFRLKRKLDNCEAINPRTKPKRIVKSIEDAGECEMVCFSVDSKDKLFCAGNDFIVTHNTELAVKNFMAYGLALNPAARFIHLSYSDDLALDNSEEVKDIVVAPAYQQLFGRVKIKPKSDSKKKWYTTSAGGVYATSTAGQVTGFGAGKVDEEIDMTFMTEPKSKLFGGALIIDDPIKPEDADSDVTRNRINERWDSTIKNRVNSRNTPIIVIMQRLHEEDLCGYLMNQSPDEWTVLSFPSIKSDGTALWPFKHTIEELHKLRKENEVVFERQHQQDPKPLAGSLFPKTELKRFKKAELTNNGLECTLGYIDVADQGTDSFCYPVGKAYHNKIFITDAIHSTAGIDVTEPLSIAQFNNTGSNFVRVEANNQGGMLIRSMKRQLGNHKVYDVTHTTKKHSRILLTSSFIKTYFHFLDESEYAVGSDYDKMMRELCSYRKDGTSKKDDSPDALSGLASFFESFVGHLFNL